VYAHKKEATISSIFAQRETVQARRAKPLLILLSGLMIPFPVCSFTIDMLDGRLEYFPNSTARFSPQPPSLHLPTGPTQ
jgi:hypothetical protein